MNFKINIQLAHDCNSSICKVGTRRSWVQGHPQRHNNSEDSLGYETVIQNT